MATEPQRSSTTREFVEFTARLLAHSPDEVQVEEKVDGETIVYTLKLASDDIGDDLGEYPIVGKDFADDSGITMRKRAHCVECVNGIVDAAIDRRMSFLERRIRVPHSGSYIR